MDAKQEFIKQLNLIRKGEFYNLIIKFFLMGILVILCLIFLIAEWIEKDVASAAFLSLAELIFLIISYMILIDARSYYSVYDSRIFQCINQPERITEIVATPLK